MHPQGRRLIPTPQEWQQKMRAAAPAWNEIRQRQEESAGAQRQRQQQLWEGFEIGDVVIFGPAATKRSYGVELCDDDGEAVLMDGVIEQIQGQFATVRIGRMHNKPAPGGGPMVGELQQIRREDILRISDKPATIWADGKQAIAAAAKRDGRGQMSYQRFWDADQMGEHSEQTHQSNDQRPT